MKKESRLKKILWGLISEGRFPEINVRKVNISSPGYDGIVISMKPSGDTGERMDFETTGNEFYAAMQHLPVGVYDVIQRNMISEVLSKTYTLEELRELKDGIEQIGLEAVRKKRGFNSLFQGRDWDTLDMYRILEYVIASKQD